MDWILVVDLGHLCLIDIFWLFGFYEWMDERATCRIIDIFCYCLCLLDFCLKLVGLRLLIFFLPPMNIEDNVQFRFGGTFAQRHCAWFLICVPNFSKIFAILPYLSMLCLWRLFFSWCSEELCIFASVWFRLTPCHLGCHWTKYVNLFLLMLSELSNLFEG